MPQKPTSSASADAKKSAAGPATAKTSTLPIRHIRTKNGDVPIYDESEAPEKEGEIEIENGIAGWVTKDGMVIRGRLTKDRLEAEKAALGGGEDDRLERLNRNGVRAIEDHFRLRGELGLLGVDPGAAEEIADKVSREGSLNARQEALERAMVAGHMIPEGLSNTGRSVKSLLDLVSDFQLLGGTDGSKMSPRVVAAIEKAQKDGRTAQDMLDLAALIGEDEKRQQRRSSPSGGSSGSPDKVSVTSAAVSDSPPAPPAPSAERTSPTPSNAKKGKKTPKAKPTPPKRIWLIGRGGFVAGPESSEGTSYPPGNDKVDLGETVITGGSPPAPRSTTDSSRLLTLPTAAPKDAFDSLGAGGARQPGNLGSAPGFHQTKPKLPAGADAGGGTGNSGGAPAGWAARPGSSGSSTGTPSGNSGSTNSGSQNHGANSGSNWSERQGNQAEGRLEQAERRGGTAQPANTNSNNSEPASNNPPAWKSGNVTVPDDEFIVENSPPDDSSSSNSGDGESNTGATGAGASAGYIPPDYEGGGRDNRPGSWKKGLRPGQVEALEKAAPRKGGEKENPGEQGSSATAGGGSAQKQAAKKNDLVGQPGAPIEPQVNHPPPPGAPQHGPSGGNNVINPSPDAPDEMRPTAGDSARLTADRSERDQGNTAKDGSNATPTPTPTPRTTRPIAPANRKPTASPANSGNQQSYMAAPPAITPPPGASPGQP